MDRSVHLEKIKVGVGNGRWAGFPRRRLLSTTAFATQRSNRPTLESQRPRRKTNDVTSYSPTSGADTNPAVTRLRGAIPPGFEPVAQGSREALVRSDRRAAIEALGFVEGKPRVAPVDSVVGRARYDVFQLDASGARVIWKQCRRGGLAERVLKDRHWGLGRFLSEVETSARSREAGLSVDEILALAWEPSGAGAVRVEVLTLRLENARDVSDLLGDSAASPALRRAVLAAVATELRRFHGCGFVHGDLNVKNILWQSASDACRATLIDLDPGPRFRPGSFDPKGPIGNLLRLWRSYVKGEARGHWHLERTELWRFLDEYFRGDRLGCRQFWLLAQQRRRLYRWRHGVRRLGSTGRSAER